MFISSFPVIACDGLSDCKLVGVYEEAKKQGLKLGESWS
jgi:hypothetical protein